MSAVPGTFRRRPSPMRRSLFLVSILVLALCAVPAFAGDGPARFAVTITNLTPGQILSPPVVVVHGPTIELFEPGQPPGPELAALAEDADASGLLALLGTDPRVLSADLADGGIEPGKSRTVEIEVVGRKRFVSVAAMLVTTNDAFAAVRSLRVTPGGTVLAYALAYDAGSEANTEACPHIPGPPCGNGGVRVEDGAEGFIHVHGGIHGGTDLVPALHDWRNPVASVTIGRIR